MSSFDVLGNGVVETEQGPVEVSLATHPDDELSVIAWLLPAGRRVGYARWSRRQPVLEVDLAPDMADESLRQLLQAVVCATSAPPADAVPARCHGQTSAATVRDVFDWQAVLDELAHEGYDAAAGR